MCKFDFDQVVPDNGYRWWYIDAVSEDGVYALTVIAFIGSVFSPYYAWSRKKQAQTKALEHCSINVALYGPGGCWSMTERNHRSVQQTAESFSVGKSSLQTKGTSLIVNLDEITVPLPRKLQGRLIIQLPSYSLSPLGLDETPNHEAQHFWQPLAPNTRIEVHMDKPELSWNGNAYVDSNYGAVPLENTFRSWTWSRSHAPDKSTSVLYDVLLQSGQEIKKTLKYSATGELNNLNDSEDVQFPKTRYWRIPRAARSTHVGSKRHIETLEDTPFYSRSKIVESNAEHTFTSVHESLDLRRFDSAWVRCLLPFRMPRTTRAVLPGKPGHYQFNSI